MEDISHKKEKFENKLNKIFGVQDAAKILDSISTPRYETFRINSRKSNVAEVLNSLGKEGFKIVTGPVTGSYVNLSSREGMKVSGTDFFKNGEIYPQGISSMLGALFLLPDAEDKILDLCASPGSKSSCIADKTGAPKNIYAVENNSARFFSMKKNFVSQGFGEIVTLKTNAVALSDVFPQLSGQFDKVLVDAPCSNEGNIRFNDEKTLKYWNPKLAKKISMLQKRLLASGYRMLKNGGTMVYSTCTYSVEENEEIVDWALKKFHDLDLVTIESDIGVRGLTVYGDKKFGDRLSKTLRILPNEYFDGFFISLFIKK